MPTNKKELSVSKNPTANRAAIMPEHNIEQPVYTYIGDHNTGQRTFDLFKILSTLFHRKWTVLLVTLFFSLLALFISSQIKTTYQANATLEIARKPYEVVKFGNVSSTGDNDEFYQTQYALLTSPVLASKVIKELGLTATQLIGNRSNSPDKASNALNDKTIEELFLSHLTITPTLKSRLVTVSFKNPDPQLASQITNTLIKNFIQSNIEKKRKATSYTEQYLTTRVHEVKKKLEESEIQLDNFASKNKIIKFDESQTLKLKALEKLEGMLVDADKDRIVANIKKRQMQENASQGIQNVINDPVIQTLKKQKAKLHADYQEMLQTFKPSYPLMLQLQNRIKQTTLDISKEKDNIINHSKLYAANNYEESREKVNKLEDKVSQLKTELMITQNKTVEYESIKRKVFSYQDLYSALLRRLNEVTVAGNAAINNISIINEAPVPRKKLGPKRALNLAAGIMLGLFSGSLLALFLEVTRGRIRSEEDLEQVANFPILGKIPKIAKRLGKEATLLIYNKSPPALTEAIRSLRTNLIYAVGQNSPRSILFTSSSEDEGKTDTAINLASAYVLLGKTVLLVDADMRNPSIDKKLLKNSSEIGLSSYLAGLSNFAEITEISRLPRLFVIPAGKPPTNPVELLAKRKMANLIKLGQQRFDVVIINSPPIRDVSDSIILSTLVEASILSVQINKTRINDISHALGRIESVNNGLLGVVATHTKQRHHDRKPQFPAIKNLLLKTMPHRADSVQY